MNPQDALRDIKPIYELSDPVNWLLILAVCALAIAVVVLLRWLASRRIKETNKGTSASFEPHPYDWLHQELAKISKLDAREFCFNLSFTFREYVERQFGFPATDRTSEEILKQLRVNYIFPDAQIQSIRKLFDIVDLVKYAGQKTDAQRTNTARDIVVAIAEKHRPLKKTTESNAS